MKIALMLTAMMMSHNLLNFCLINTLMITNFMEQSSLGSNSHSDSQQMPHILWNLKAHYHVHRSLPLACILSQMNPVHTFPHCIF
jgi:hypothetical protein